MVELEAKVTEYKQQVADLTQKVEEAQQAAATAAAASAAETANESTGGGPPPPPAPPPPPPPPPPAAPPPPPPPRMHQTYSFVILNGHALYFSPTPFCISHTLNIVSHYYHFLDVSIGFCFSSHRNLVKVKKPAASEEKKAPAGMTLPSTVSFIL